MNQLKEFEEMHPQDIRKLISEDRLRIGTAGLCPGFVQASLTVLDGEYAKEFEDFASKNEKVCPIMEKTDGTPFTTITANHANILKDVAGYYIWVDGKIVNVVPDASDYWQEGMTGYITGSSLSFDKILIDAGIGMRHITLGSNIPLYKTNIATTPSAKGRFAGPVIVTMRPINRNLVDKAVEITSRFPYMHGAPIHVGDPAILGIDSINEPDWGDPVYFAEGDVPVFWISGITIQSAISASGVPFAITQAVGYNFITDLLTETLSL